MIVREEILNMINLETYEHTICLDGGIVLSKATWIIFLSFAASSSP